MSIAVSACTWDAYRKHSVVAGLVYLGLNYIFPPKASLIDYTLYVDDSKRPSLCLYFHDGGWQTWTVLVNDSNNIEGVEATGQPETDNRKQADEEKIVAVTKD